MDLKTPFRKISSRMNSVDSADSRTVKEVPSRVVAGENQIPLMSKRRLEDDSDCINSTPVSQDRFAQIINKKSKRLLRLMLLLRKLLWS